MITARGPLVATLALIVTLSASADGQTQGAVFATDVIDFGRVMRGEVVEREFILRNTGAEPLRVHEASMTPPLVATSLPSVVPPGGEGPLRFRLDTARLQGLVEATIVVSLGTPPATVTLKMHGFVVPPIELLPGPVFFLGAARGEPKEQSIEIVNHESTPLRITSIAQGAAPFVTRLDMLEEGRRYRLTVRTNADAPLGRRADTIVLVTSSQVMPRITVQVNTFVHERVYTFPESVDLGTLPLTQLRKNPAMVEALAQRAMVYGSPKANFAVSATTDLAFLALRVERSSSEDRWQITATLNPDRLREGPIAGSIVIETNDPEFRTLHMPVVGAILP